MAKSIKKNIFMSIILTSANFLFPLIIYSYISRVLTPTYVGKVSFVNSIITFLSYIAVLGIPTYGLRQCSIVKNDKEKLSKTVIELLSICLIMTLISYLLLIFGIVFVPILNEYKDLLLIMSIYILLNSIGVEWFYKAMEEYSYITIRSIIFKLISLILIFLLIKSPNDYILYGFLSIFALSANYVCNIFHLKKFIKIEKYKLDLKKHMKPILILFSASIAITIYNNFDVIMLRIFNSDFEVGLYNSALKIKTALMAILLAITSVLIPRITYFLNNKLEEDARQLLIKSIKLSFLTVLPLCVFTGIFAREIIILFCGMDYIDTVLTVRILLISIAVCIFTNLYGNLILVPANQEKSYTFSVTVGLVMNILLNLAFIPKYGAAGAAFSTALTEIWNVFYMSWCSHKYIKNIIQIKEIYKFLVCTVFSTLVGSAFLLLTNVSRPIFIVTIGTIIFFGIYYLALLFMHEKFLSEEIKKIFKKFSNKER